MKHKKHFFETFVHGVFLLLGLVTVGCVLLITLYLIFAGIPAIREIGLFSFLLGDTWASTAQQPSFGILPFILTSVYGTAGAILLGVPIGFLSAVYLAKLAPAPVKKAVSAAVSLLAGIPSVVYGLVGMMVLVPAVRRVFRLPDGASLLAAIVVLGIMILPSIISVSITASGAQRIRGCFPCAWGHPHRNLFPGIGPGGQKRHCRSGGAGGGPCHRRSNGRYDGIRQCTEHAFDFSKRALSHNRRCQRNVLFQRPSAAGPVLHRAGIVPVHHADQRCAQLLFEAQPGGMTMAENHIKTKRKVYIGAMNTLMILSALFTCALVLFLAGYVLIKGLPNITWELLSTSPSYLSGRIGILPDILNTVYLILASLVIVIPLGAGAAVYLTEYAQNKRLVSAIEYAAETLSGIPSIIYGLVGMLFFCQFLNLQTSLLAGALTLVIMNLPTILRTTQESLKTVPQSYREGAFGLGAGKWRVIRTVVLPGCIDGIVTGCILSIGRILGESAALLFTAGFAHAINGFWDGLGSAGASLTVALYVYAKEQGEFGVAFAIAAILMILTLFINLLAAFVGRLFQKRRSL